MQMTWASIPGATQYFSPSRGVEYALNEVHQPRKGLDSIDEVQNVYFLNHCESLLLDSSRVQTNHPKADQIEDDFRPFRKTHEFNNTLHSIQFAVSYVTNLKQCFN